MQIDSVATNAGVATSAAPSRMACAQRLAHVHMAVVVLDLDRRVVHQNADRQRQPAQRHHVERLVQDVEHDDGGQDRQRDRRDDDQGAPPGAQEQQDHQRRQAAGDRPFVDDAGDGRPHEDALVEQEVDVEALAAGRPESWASVRARRPRPRGSKRCRCVRIGSSAECRPSRRTRLVCGLNPSWTNATSRTYTSRPVHVADRDVIQVVQNAPGCCSIATSYSIASRSSPCPARQDDVLRQIALTTSCGDSPRA